jgi:hypothetical protein
MASFALAFKPGSCPDPRDSPRVTAGQEILPPKSGVLFSAFASDERSPRTRAKLNTPKKPHLSSNSYNVSMARANNSDAPVAQPGRTQARPRALPWYKPTQRGKGHGFKSRPGLHTLRRTSARLHLRNPIMPSRQLSHLLQHILLRLLSVHPARIHRCLHHILELSLKRQKLSVHISAMDAVRIIRVLSAVLLVSFHRHSTALTARSERHSSNRNKSRDNN